MKHLLLFCLFFFSLSLKGQSLQLVNESYTFEKLDSAKNLEKRIIYDKARKWVVRNLKSSDSNIELNDTSFSQITSTGNLLLEDEQYSLVCVLTNFTVNFKLNILIKQGRYKVVFDKMMLSNTTVCYKSDGSSPSKQYHEYPLEKLGLSKKKHAKVMSEMESKFLKLCTDLNKEINGQVDKSTDW